MRKNSYEILFEDADLLVVNKPPGITVIPQRDILLPSLQKALEKQYGRLFVVHRLDKDTSGVVCFARNESAHKHLSEQFEKRTVQKFYTAIVRGKMEKESGEINYSLAPHPAKPNMVITHPKGKPSLTKYTTQEKFQGASLLKLEMMTGRTHQIRVHLAAINHPLLVDEVYGTGKGFYLSSIKKNYKTAEEERPVMDRLTLHAAELRIIHPATGEEKIFIAEMPDDMKTLLKLLRRYDV